MKRIWRVSARNEDHRAVVFGDIDRAEGGKGQEAAGIGAGEFHGLQGLAEAVAEGEGGDAGAGFGGAVVGTETNASGVSGGGAKENEGGGAGIEDEFAGFAVDGGGEGGAAFGVFAGELNALGGGMAVEDELAFGEIEEVAVAAEPGLAEHTIGVGESDGGEDDFDGFGGETGEAEFDGTGEAEGGAGNGDLFDAGEGGDADGGGDFRAKGGRGGAGIDDHAEGAFAV